MSYNDIEIEEFNRVKEEIMGCIQRYYKVAHEAVNVNCWTDIYKEKVRDSIIKLMEFERLVGK